MKLTVGSEPFILGHYKGASRNERPWGRGTIAWAPNLSLSGYFIDGTIDGDATLTVVTPDDDFYYGCPSKMSFQLYFLSGVMRSINLAAFSNTLDYKNLMKMKRKLINLHRKWIQFDESYWLRNMKNAERSCDEIDSFLADWDRAADAFEEFFWDVLSGLLQPLWTWIDKGILLRFPNSLAYRSIDIESDFLYQLRSELYNRYLIFIDEYRL